jgi:hypothetical protein
MSCQICGAKVKNPETASHINSKRHQNAIGGFTSSKASVKVNGDLEKRVTLLENQMKQVIKSLNNMESMVLNLSSQNSRDDSSVSYGNTDRIKVLQQISPDSSITVDELVRRFKGFEWKKLEKILMDLIDEEQIDGIEGKSSRRVHGKFGRVIRR